MKKTETDFLKKNIEQSIAESVFMPESLRNRATEMLTKNISDEKLQKILDFVKQIVTEEEKIIKDILAKDPLYFKNIKRKISREKLAKKLKNESRLQADELQKIEAELTHLMIS